MKLLLKNCDILSSENGKFRCVKNGFLGIDGDTIDYIGETATEARYDTVKDMSGKMLVPGFINTHTHSPMCILRGIGSGLKLQTWLYDVVFPTEDRMKGVDVRAGTELAILEMLAGGTTSFSDMYMNSDDIAEAVLEAGIKANIGRPIMNSDPNEPLNKNYRLLESLDLYDRYNGRGDGRILVDFSIHAEYTNAQDLVEYCAGVAREKMNNMHIHMSETKSEHEECIRKYGKTPAKWFNDLGVFDTKTFAAHCVWVTDEDMDIMKEKGVSAVHNPTSNMKLGSGYAPIRRLLDKGICVGLGTDGAASNNNLNMLEEMHLAAVIHNGYSCDPTHLQPDEIFRLATVNGAHIQGRYDTGELAVGKKADIVAMNMDAPHLVPNLDPVALMCYSAQASDVCMTMVDGRILYENGEYTTVDKERVYAHVREAMERLY